MKIFKTAWAAALALSLLLGAPAQAQKQSTLPTMTTPAGTETLTGLQGGANKNATFNQIRDFVVPSAANAEVIRDTMGTALVAGANVTITPNDGADTITIAASGGGGGGGAAIVTSTSAPTVNDDTGDGYAVGQTWLQTTTGTLYIARTVGAGTAEWVPMNYRLGFGYTSGNFYGPTRSSIGSTAYVANTAYATMFEIRERVTLTGVGLKVSTGAASSNIMACVYDTVAGKPFNLLASITTPMSGATSANVTGTFTSALAVNPGAYWIRLISDGTPTATAIVSGDQAISNWLGGSSINDVLVTSAQANGWSRSDTYSTTCPNPFGVPTAFKAAIPSAAFQVQ